MGQISSLFVHKVVAAVTAGEPGDGARRRAMLQSVGVDPDAPIDSKQMIADSDNYDLCERVAHEDPHGVSVPLRVGVSMRCDDYGTFGLAWKSQRRADRKERQQENLRRIEDRAQQLTSHAPSSRYRECGR